MYFYKTKIPRSGKTVHRPAVGFAAVVLSQ